MLTGGFLFKFYKFKWFFWNKNSQSMVEIDILSVENKNKIIF